MGYKRIFILQINKKALILISVIFLLSVGACRSKKDAALPPRIVFLNYSVAKESDGAIKIEFINKIITEGKLKQNLSNKKNPEFGDLKIIQINSKSKPIQSITVTNPLVKNVEYADESGQLNRKIIELESTQFSIRMQMHPLTKFVVIEQINKPNKRLIKSRL